MVLEIQGESKKKKHNPVTQILITWTAREVLRVTLRVALRVAWMFS